MIRLLLVIAAACAAAAEAPSATAAAPVLPKVAALSPAASAALARADELQARYFPDLLALAPGHEAPGRHLRDPLHRMDSPFVGPAASDVAVEVRKVTWFSALVFLPFLVIPQALLLYVIFRFRDRRDGRKPATFTGNHTIEVVWTAIPCLALLIVSVPVWNLAWWMEDPPRERVAGGMRIEVIGSQFKWDYKYHKLGGDRRAEDEPAKPLEVGSGDMLQPEPLVLVKGRVVTLDMTSRDVNHAWWIPAFGVKQDTIIGRHTHAWFTPIRTGFYKGQCAELCGKDHGYMLISAVVVEADQFEQEWVPVQRHRAAVGPVISALRKQDEPAVAAAVAGFLAAGDDAERRLALHFWVANHFTLMARTPTGLKPAQVAERAAAWRRFVAERSVQPAARQGAPS